MGWREDNADINEKIYRLKIKGIFMKMKAERRELEDMEFRSWLMWERYKMELRRERLEMRSPESGKTQPRNNKGQYKKYKTDGSGNGGSAAGSTGVMNMVTPNTVQQNIGGINGNPVLTGGVNGGIINHRTDEPFSIEDPKIVDYMLNPEKKHYKEFIAVGYSESDPQKLYEDILDAVDINSIQERGKNAAGNNAYEVKVMLGITEKKPFVVGFEKRPNAEKLRLVTVHRVRTKKGK